MSRHLPLAKPMRRFSMRAIGALCALGAGFCASAMAQTGEIVQPLPTAELAAPVADDQAGFRIYLGQVRGKALAMGISPATLDAVFPTLTPSPRVIRLDQSQPAGPVGTAIPPFEPYRREHVDSARINGGREVWAAERAELRETEQKTGVPGAVVVAIFGHETHYGSFVGDFDLVRSLATLAYEGRRRDLFEPEFLAALKMLDKGIPRSKMVGSWAGATGYPQFLPSVYLRVARDGDGDGSADIWSSRVDALASIAAYFVDAGWRRGEPWGVAVRVPVGFDRAAIASRLHPPRCQRVFERHSRWLSIAEWRQRGIEIIGNTPIGENTFATLLEPDGPGKTAYLLTVNYRAILDYNCSNFYALSVGLLADAVDD